MVPGPTPPDRRALVTGATGYIGSRLVPALAAAGWSVTASGRRPRPEGLDAAVAYRPADLVGDGDLGGLVEGVTHVFHLAGASSSRSSDEEMERTNRLGTRRLVAAAVAAGVRRLVHMSSTSVYGEEVQLPVPVTEDVTCQPSRSYGRAKLGAEEEAAKGAAEGLEVVVLRPVTVYGPGAVKLLASAVLDVAIERFAGLDVVEVPAEAVEQRLLHVDDLLAATLHVAEHPDAPGRAFNVASGAYPTSHEVAEVVADELGMATTLAEGAEVGLSFERRRVVHQAMLEVGMTGDILLSPQRFRFLAKANRNNRLSLAALEGTGFRFAETDWDASVRRTVAWYRDRRWVI